MDDLISRAAAIARIDKCVALSGIGLEPVMAIRDIKALISVMPAVDAIPVEWLNERHRKCCEEGDTDLMDAITVLCNEYHVWQKEQEAR